MTGRNTDRPQFLQMIKDSSKKNFQAVLVYQLDRFSRNRYDSATYKAKLKANGVCVMSAKENISQDASGILMEAVLEGMAEYYSKELSQKVKRGMKLNAEKCLYNGGTVPLGYKIIDKKYVINEETAPYVRKIFEMYAGGNSIKEIIEYLNGTGIKPSKNTKFNYHSLHVMLHNKKYIGIYQYGDVEIKDGVPRIIDDKLFEKVQKEALKNKKAPARNKANEEYLLTTKLFCGHCMEMMVGMSGTSQSKKKYCYYSCSKARRKQCTKKNVGKHYLEDYVVNACRKQLTDENISMIVKEVIDCNKDDISLLELKRIEKEIARLGKEKTSLMASLRSCDIESVKQDIFKEIENINIEIESLNQQTAIIKNNLVVVDEMEIRFFLTKLRDGNINDKKYRKMLINVLVNKIYLYDDKIRFVFNTDSNPVEFSDSLIEKQDEKENCSTFASVGSPKKHSAILSAF